MFPSHRPRRLRSSAGLRNMVRETTLTRQDLIYPLFAVPGEGVAKEVVSMPGVYLVIKIESKHLDQTLF